MVIKCSTEKMAGNLCDAFTDAGIFFEYEHEGEEWLTIHSDRVSEALEIIMSEGIAIKEVLL